MNDMWRRDPQDYITLRSDIALIAVEAEALGILQSVQDNYWWRTGDWN